MTLQIGKPKDTNCIIGGSQVPLLDAIKRTTFRFRKNCALFGSPKVEISTRVSICSNELRTSQVSVRLEHGALVVFERCIVVLQFDLIVKQVLTLAVFKSD